MVIETGFGYIAAIIVGLTLGMLGSGGSILTVPVFAYLFHVPGALATTYSLFVVGVGALFGAIDYARKGLVDGKALLSFGIPSSFGMFMTRGLLVPSLPKVLIDSGPVKLALDHAVLMLFGVLMLGASIAMFNPVVERADSGPRRTPQLVGYGLLVGCLMGLVGAGGGFLIVPALSVLAGLDMRKAAGTSLAVIALNSGLGFSAAAAQQPIDWRLVGGVATLTVIGIGIGSFVGGKIEASKLKKGFAWLVLFMAIWVLGTELAHLRN